MKKFYYKKEASQDKTPTAISLERRHTMDVNIDGEQQQQNCVSARAASVSSLDRLKDAPKIPRIRSRESSVKSLSEGVVGKAQKIVTESDLSSSWLYKTMQASINSRFKSPRKSPCLQQKDDLEPTVLEDPKLKPIPVKSRAERTSSCLCHFATMIAISILTIGFLVSIAAIIYMEVFANRNLTSLHTTEARIDLSDVVLDSRKGVNNLTAHNYVNPRHDMQKYSTEIPGDELQNAYSEKNSKILDKDTEKPDLTELNEHINSTKTEIKFQDGETVVYEIKSENFKDKLSGSNKIEGFNSKSLNLSLNENGTSTEKYVETFEEQVKEKFETVSDSQLEESKDVFIADRKFEYDSKSEESVLYENLLNDLEQFKSDNRLKLDSISERSVLLDKTEKSTSNVDLVLEEKSESIVEPDRSEIFHSKDFESERYSNRVKNDMNTDEKLESVDSEASYSILNEMIDASKVGGILKEYNILPTIEYVDDSQLIKEHNVDSMVVTVDEPEEDSIGTLNLNRNEVDPSEFSSRNSTIPSTAMQTDGTFQISSQKSEDIKASLAEAMKHFHALDVNNRLLTSRSKFSKQKTQTPKRQNKLPPKVDSALEQKRYLQKVRMMLYEQLQ